MRGVDQEQGGMFSYLSPETRVRQDHPLRTIRVQMDEVLAGLSPVFEAMYSTIGRPSIPPEKLLRALMLASAGVLLKNAPPAPLTLIVKLQM